MELWVYLICGLLAMIMYIVIQYSAARIIIIIKKRGYISLDYGKT